MNKFEVGEIAIIGYTTDEGLGEEVEIMSELYIYKNAAVHDVLFSDGTLSFWEPKHLRKKKPPALSTWDDIEAIKDIGWNPAKELVT